MRRARLARCIHKLTVEAPSERRVARGLGVGIGCLRRDFGLVKPGAPPNRTDNLGMHWRPTGRF